MQRPRMSHSTYSFKLILLNRRENTDFVEELVADVDFQRVGQHVYMRNPTRGTTLNETQSRVIYFSIESEAKRFMEVIESPMRDIKGVY